MIWPILPESCPLGLLSPRRSPPSLRGSLSSVRIRRRMRNNDIHCRKREPLQHRHDVAPALAFNHALLAGQGPIARLRRRLAAANRDDQVQGCCQVYHSATGSSWLPSLRPTHYVLLQQLLHCICTAGGPRQRKCGASSCATLPQQCCRCRVSCGRRGWRSGKPQQALRTSCGAWQRRAPLGGVEVEA